MPSTVQWGSTLGPSASSSTARNTRLSLQSGFYLLVCECVAWCAYVRADHFFPHIRYEKVLQQEMECNVPQLQLVRKRAIWAIGHFVLFIPPALCSSIYAVLLRTLLGCVCVKRGGEGGVVCGEESERARERERELLGTKDIVIRMSVVDALCSMVEFNVPGTLAGCGSRGRRGRGRRRGGGDGSFQSFSKQLGQSLVCCFNC